jgi:hypothetical protein
MQLQNSKSGRDERIRVSSSSSNSQVSRTDVANRGVFAKIKSVGRSKTPGKIRGIEDEDDHEYENDSPG